MPVDNGTVNYLDDIEPEEIDTDNVKNSNNKNPETSNEKELDSEDSSIETDENSNTGITTPETPEDNESESENSEDPENTESDVTIPDESEDIENEYEEEQKPEEKPSYPHNHVPGTVPALFTYYEGTKLLKVIAVSNDCDKLIKYGNQLRAQIHMEYELSKKILENYFNDPEANSIELFLLFANTYNVIGGIISEDSLNEKVNELKSEGNRVAIKESKQNNKNRIEIYYSTDLKSLEEVLEENKEIQPELNIANIIVL